MFKAISKGFADEIKVYGLFVAILILVSIVVLIVGLIIYIGFPSKANCALTVAFTSVGTFLFSVGLTNRAKEASKKAGRRKK